ncbi:F-BAR and double SH3 domains protein 2-like [Sinocyclocheilus rhinocerous]|uniref:F-BAR and double SH3 domains protein 2-like n=1 Tax=Sinocyclocheilus rhinocerous TaxID=307959 RepID=UPI0007B7E820|nr:PREDICTED: F-BAR and double SH3 domains protein 2-like [Sinocyclocheilus rhinocerous]
MDLDDAGKAQRMKQPFWVLYRSSKAVQCPLNAPICAPALQKLASQYLKRDWPGIKPDDQRTDYRNVYGVWRAYLEGTVQVTQSRLNVCENYKNEISDPAKTLRLYKEQQLKKCIEQLGRIQAELQDSAKDLAKSKKKYFELEQMAQAVREKADIESKSKLGLFQSRISLQKASVKLKAKRSDCNSKATHARNEYLLTLAAANAHHDRYYQTDLANCIKGLEGNVYDHVKDYLISFCRTELEAFQAVHSTFQFLLEKSSRVMQDFNQQLFLQENPVFHKAQDFQFQPSDSDMTLSSVQQLVDIEPSTVSVMRMTLAQSRQLESETGTTEEHSLNKEARKWATRVAREHKNIIHYKRALEECETLGTLPTEQSRNELEFRIEEAKESIRKAETIKLKAEVRLDLLRQVGVSVDTWLKSAMNQVMEELENERWASLPTLTSHDLSLSVSTLFIKNQSPCQRYMQIFSPALSHHCIQTSLNKQFGTYATAERNIVDHCSQTPPTFLYTSETNPFEMLEDVTSQASQPDELTIDEHEMLEVIEDGDMEDWVKARNKSGQVGYVPEKYLQFPTSNSVLSMLQSLAALDARSHSSSNSTEPELASGSFNGDSSMSFVKAMYDYEGQTDDELSFPEGAIIRILNKDNQEDDGFWEGEFNGRVGVFPSVLVEDLTASENGDSHWGTDTQVSPCQRLHSSLPPLPLYDQPPCSPYTSPETSSAPSLPRSPSVNGEHKLPIPQKAAGHNHNSSLSPESPGFSQPLRLTPDGSGSGKLRPVRAAPPPPKQHARRQVEKTEEVEITLV